MPEPIPTNRSARSPRPRSLSLQQRQPLARHAPIPDATVGAQFYARPAHSDFPLRRPIFGVGVAALLCVVIISIIASMQPDRAESSGTSTPSGSQSTPVELPLGAVECSHAGSGRFARSARGNGVTTCPFSENVLQSFIANGDTRTPKTIQAYSPVTNRTYTLICTLESLIACRGGENALVYVY